MLCVMYTLRSNNCAHRTQFAIITWSHLKPSYIRCYAPPPLSGIGGWGLVGDSPRNYAPGVFDLRMRLIALVPAHTRVCTSSSDSAASAVDIRVSASSTTATRLHISIRVSASSTTLLHISIRVSASSTTRLHISKGVHV